MSKFIHLRSTCLIICAVFILTGCAGSTQYTNQDAYNYSVKHYNEFSSLPNYKAMVTGKNSSTSQPFWSYNSGSNQQAIELAFQNCYEEYNNCFLFADSNGWSKWTTTTSNNNGTVKTTPPDHRAVKGKAYSACVDYYNNKFRPLPTSRAMAAGADASSSHCWWRWSYGSNQLAIESALQECQKKYSDCFIFADSNGMSEWAQTTSDQITADKQRTVSKPRTVNNTRRTRSAPSCDIDVDDPEGAYECMEQICDFDEDCADDMYDDYIRQRNQVYFNRGIQNSMPGLQRSLDLLRRSRQSRPSPSGGNFPSGTRKRAKEEYCYGDRSGRPTIPVKPGDTEGEKALCVWSR